MIRVAPLPGTALLVVLLATACSSGSTGTGNTTPPPPGPPPPPPQQTIQFTVLPMALADLENVAPIGNLNPPGHTFPSDHIGLTHTTVGQPPSGAYVVYAPAAGHVRAVYGGGPDAGIEVGPQPLGEVGGERTWYYMGHIILDPGIGVGSQLTAGQRIGTNSGMAGGVDFGLVDMAVTNGFIRGERYGIKMKHAVKPLSRFTPALRAQLAAMVDRTGANDEDGKLVYDMAGRLIGNWFHESLPYDQSAETSPANWSKHLAFTEIPTTAGERVIATGGFGTGESTVYWIEPAATDFATVSPSSGKVVYRSVAGLRRWWQHPVQADRYFLVEMTGPETLRIEMFMGATAPTAFTAAAQTYKR